MASKEVCYEYFDCKELDCIRRKDLAKNCWEIDGVSCHCHSEEFDRLRKQLGSKLAACKLCIFYQRFNKT